MLATFFLAMLTGASLLFLVQPMVAKGILPLLGGSPSVWNTCLVFFQAGLLAGYAYAHALGSRRSLRAQVGIHAAVLLLPFAFLPIGTRGLEAPPGEGSPVAWLLVALTFTCGVPFFVVATTGPLLQRWFSRTGHSDSGDPYFLYAASNVGSFAGLLAYPFLLEPWLTLGGQARLWTGGYALYVVVVLGCAAWTLRAGREEVTAPRAPAAPPVAWTDRLLWLVFAFVPSSLLLATTQYLTTDIASVPLLWVVPLALYLLTFVVVFAKSRPRWLVPASGAALALLAVAVAAVTFPGIEPGGIVELVLVLLAMVAAALVAHGRLADARPEASHLTEYYLVIALGGVLGGAFNALAAPVLFKDVLEFPLMLAAACFLRPPSGAAGKWRLGLDLAVPVALAGLLLATGAFVKQADGLSPLARSWIAVGLPATLCLAMMAWTRRFGLAFAVLLGFAWTRAAGSVNVIHQERTFFGVHRVLDFEGKPYKVEEAGNLVFANPFRVLLHGPTRHGMQSQDARRRGTPTTYFHPTGPIGHVFERLRERGRPVHMGLIGLGAGSLAAYGRAGDAFTIYDIDPAVVRIARNPAWFTFVSDSKAKIDFVLGDGRLRIAEAEDGAYDLIVIDAFSSDAIPVHLLTREAVEIYLRKLRPDGLVAFHLSNQYVDLAPVVEAIAHDLGRKGAVRWDRAEGFSSVVEAKDDSTWAILQASPDATPLFEGDARWWPIPREELAPTRARYRWTDDFSNVVGAMKAFRPKR